MSSIHYKFRATLEYKTLQFDGLHIRGEDLVREICSKENINIELFNLLLQNAHTKKTYTDEELIPRNSSITVQRVPRTEVKVQKVQSGVNSGMINQGDASSISADGGSHIPSADFENMDEAERLSHVKEVSTKAYDPSNFRKKTAGIMSGPPPPTYTCNRCYQPGHWYKNCPMLNTKRTTGIPSQELMQTTADDPLAMRHPSGKYVVPIMHWKARQDQIRKMEEGSSSPAQDRRVPAELECPICQNLIKEAVVTSCCGNSYCADCIGHFIVDSEAKKCPGSDCTNDQVTVDSLIPNKRLREAAEAWLNQRAANAAPQAPEGQGQPADPIRIRIGLQPKPLSSTPSLGVLSPGSIPTLDPTVVESAPGVTQPPVGVESVPVPVAAPVPAPAPTSVTVPQVPIATQPVPATSQTINIPLDTSLPPPLIRAQVPVAAEPLVPGIPTISTYLQPPPGIPGISMVPQQQTQQVMPGYMMSGPSMGMYSSGSAGFQTAPTTSTRGYDDWDNFLKNKNGRDDRRMISSRRDTRRRSPHGRERERDKERERDRARRKERDTRMRKKRTPSSSTESSESSSSSSSDDERRRRKREKQRDDLRKRRSDEKDRLKRDHERDRRERERERERERSRRDREKERESKSSRSKTMKVHTSRRDHREKEEEPRRRRRDVRKEEEDDEERKEKEMKEEDDEAAIDGALAEYEKLRESASEMNVNDDDEPKAGGEEDEQSNHGSDHEKERGGEDEEEEEDTAEDEPIESGTEACEGETTRSERDASEPVEESGAKNLLTTETSEAEVTENKKEDVISPNEGTAPATEESDMTADEKEVDKAANEKESQSSTANTDDDGKKEKKREKKHKKHKKKDKKHRKHAEDDEEDNGDKKRKKHKKHKKEKKSKREKKENRDDKEDEGERDDDRDRKKHRKKDRKRERETEEDSDSDAPRSKNRRKSEDIMLPAKSSRSRNDENVREKEKHREKERDRDRDRDRDREKESEKRKEDDEPKKKKDDEHKKEPTTSEKTERKDESPSVSSSRKPISFVVTTPALKTAPSSSSPLKPSPKLKKVESDHKRDERARETRDAERSAEKSSEVVKPKKSLSERMERRRKDETDVESGDKSKAGDDRSRRSRGAQMMRQVQRTLDSNAK